MQKKIIALAVAGLMSGAAFAQSNVTVYGAADIYFGQDKASKNPNGTLAAVDGPKDTVLNNGGVGSSHFGFRGSEDLGGGLKALFQFEIGYNLDTGLLPNAAANSRQSFVGLQGNWGTFVAGALYTPGYNQSNKFSGALGAGRFSASRALQNLSGASIVPAAALPNAMAYVSPDMNGFKATVAYSTNSENVRGKTDRVFGLGLDYDKGPLSVGFSHHNLNTPTLTSQAASTTTVSLVSGADLATVTAACTGTLTSVVSSTVGAADRVGLCSVTTAGAITQGFQTKQTENFLGGSYDFGVAKVFLTYQNLKAKQNGVETAKNNIWGTGVAIPFGASTVRVNYARMDDKRTVNQDARAWTVSYNYALSKRTSTYAGYTDVRTKNGGLGRPHSGLAPEGNATNKSTSWGVGLRHTF